MTGPQQFRTKPAHVEAMQWDGTAEGATPIIDWVLAGGGTARFRDWAWGNEIVADAGEVLLVAVAGDWIVRKSFGEFVPCTAETFDATYECPEGSSS